MLGKYISSMQTETHLFHTVCGFHLPKLTGWQQPVRPTFQVMQRNIETRADHTTLKTEYLGLSAITTLVIITMCSRLT